MAYPVIYERVYRASFSLVVDSEKGPSLAYPMSMFALLKIFQQFLSPPALFFAAFVVGFLVLRRKPRGGRIILMAAIIAYYILSLEPTAYLLERTLVRATPSGTAEQAAEPQAIVVLGGGAQAEPGRAFPELDGASWKRLWRGFELYRAHQGRVPILYVGGSGDPFEPISYEAKLARQYGIAFGVPAEQFWIEARSRDTYENGLAVRHILAERLPAVKSPKVALVTSAIHLPRAMRVLEGLGMTVIPVPADFGASRLNLDPLSFFPTSSALSKVVAIAHEWLGLVSYNLRGRI